jgi:predicted RND superfamily exporter protein
MAFGIAVDDAVHFIAYWQRLRSAGTPPSQALEETVSVKGRPIVFTSLILVFTFAVFTGSSFPPLAQFGSLCAMTFLIALAATCLVIPCLLCTMED